MRQIGSESVANVCLRSPDTDHAGASLTITMALFNIDEYSITSEVIGQLTPVASRLAFPNCYKTVKSSFALHYPAYDVLVHMHSSHCQTENGPEVSYYLYDIISSNIDRFSKSYTRQ